MEPYQQSSVDRECTTSAERRWPSKQSCPSDRAHLQLLTPVHQRTTQPLCLQYYCWSRYTFGNEWEICSFSGYWCVLPVGPLLLLCASGQMRKIQRGWLRHTEPLWPERVGFAEPVSQRSLSERFPGKLQSSEHLHRHAV